MSLNKALVRNVAVVLVSGVALGASLSACSSVPFVGGKKSAPKTNAQQGIGVNAYLWRASLDTLSSVSYTHLTLPTILLV